MDNLNTLARDTELKYTKKHKHAKQIKLRKILAKKNTNKKLPVQYKAKKTDKPNHFDCNVNTLFGLFLSCKSITNRKQYLHFWIHNDKAELTITSKSRLRKLNLLKKLNLGCSTNRKVRINKNKCYISYYVHLNKNFYRAMNLITKKFHSRFKVKMYQLFDGINCSRENFFDKYHSRLINLFSFSPIALISVFSVIMGLYGKAQLPIPSLIVFSLLCGIILSIGLFMAGIILFFSIALFISVFMLVVEHIMSKKLGKHKKFVLHMISKFTKQSPSKVLNILTNYKS